MKKYSVLLISSSSSYRVPETREVVKKKFRKLSEIGEISLIAVSEDGRRIVTEFEGGHLHLAPATGVAPLDTALFMSFAVKEGLKIIKERCVDIIYCQTPLIDGLVGLKLKKLTGAKLVIGIHGDWEGEIRFSKPGLARFMPLINCITGFVLKQADAIRAISRATRESALEFVPKEKLFPGLFPALFDVEFFLEGEVREPEGNSAVFVGSLIGRKGIDFLLRAVPRVLKDFPDFRLYIVGKGNKKGELKALARELGIEESIEFVGHQPAEKVREYIDRSRVLVLPSLSEGLGRIALEAMARGRPVIGSYVEGIKETINKERGYPVPSKNPKAISDALLEVFSDVKTAKKKGRVSREYVRREYSMGKYLKNYRGLFSFVLEK